MAEWNSRLSILGAAFILLAAIGCRRGVTERTEPEAPPPGVASFDPRSVDLGDVPLYSDKTFTARFRNRGATTIEIAAFRANCGCAVLCASNKVCGPGEEIEITGIFKAGSRGSFRKQLSAHAKDGAEYEFEIIGNVKPEIEFDQDGITLAPDFLEGKNAGGAIEIVNHSSKTIHLQQPLGLPAGLQARLDRVDVPPGKNAKLSFESSLVFVTNTDAKVEVATSHRLEGTLSIPVRIRPTQALTVVPGEVRLGVASKDQLLKRGKLSLTLLGKALDRLTIESVECPKYLKLESRPANLDRRAELQFKFVDSFAGVDLVGEITVKLIDRNTEGGSRSIRLRVPISGLLQES